MFRRTTLQGRSSLFKLSAPGGSIFQRLCGKSVVGISTLAGLLVLGSTTGRGYLGTAVIRPSDAHLTNSGLVAD